MAALARLDEPARRIYRPRHTGPARARHGYGARASRLAAVGHAYERRLLPDRRAILFQMQAYATSDPEIREYVRESYRTLVRTVAELGGVEEDETWDFFATGMMLSVMAMLGLDWFPERA